ncbi:glucan biosynthesis protein [Sphingobium sp. AN641]|uniref:glucan biosynthesis protein n=1 Tax=Sphingobium sp. AN641 TaxID=3133443 RepID=UPI0030BF3A06
MTRIDRRAMIAATSAALMLPSALRAQPHGTRFSWEILVAMAQRLGRRPFAQTPAHPGAAKVDYEALHVARFRYDRTLWNDMPGDVAVRFFPLSATAPQPVAIHVVEGGYARPLPYDPTMFDAPVGNAVAALGRDAGFAGFRVMNGARDADWLSFLGASYFRSAGAHKQYGLSARAIAINTSVGNEEFPRFTSFWLERSGSDSLIVHALLDGASITGAFRFVNRLSAQGVSQEVTAALFPRRAIAELGLMPMTSMFWYDQANRATAGTDWRPEIHDSDMLAIQAADGAAHARPLVNPRAPRVSIFAERDPAAFALVQRDREFDHYQDDGVFYHRRPSLRATPRATLGAGQVRLYEFPTTSEYVDNVAAYWMPALVARPGRRIDAAYRLDWGSSEPPLPIVRLADIWRGAAEAGGQRIVLDFTGVPPGIKPQLWTDVSGAALVKRGGYPVIGLHGTFRVALDVRVEGGAGADLRVQLRDGGRAISEMVHYPIAP